MTKWQWMKNFSFTTSKTQLIFLVNKSTYEIREKNLNTALIESHNEIKDLSAKLSIANMDIGFLKAEIKRYKSSEAETNLKIQNSDLINEEIQNSLKNKVSLLKNYIMRK